MNKFDDYMRRKDNGSAQTCMRCTSIVYAPGDLGPKGMLCGPHHDEFLAKEEQRAKDKALAVRRLIREYVQGRVNAAIPDTYSVMQGYDETLTNDNEMVRMMETFNERIRTRDNVSVIVAAREAAKEALYAPGMVLLFAGPTGVGKSHMLAFALRTLANLVPLEPPQTNPVSRRKGGGLFSSEWVHEGDNPEVLWTSGKKLFDAAKRDEDMRPYEDVALLALDDIGNEPRQVNIGAVHDVVFERYDNNRTIFATTGYMDEHADPTDLDAFLAPLAARYDKAFVRRLAKIPARVRVIPMLPPA